MLCSDLVSRVGALHRDNIIAPFPLGQKSLSKKNYYDDDEVWKERSEVRAEMTKGQYPATTVPGKLRQ